MQVRVLPGSLFVPFSFPSSTSLRSRWWGVGRVRNTWLISATVFTFAGRALVGMPGHQRPSEADCGSVLLRVCAKRSCARNREISLKPIRIHVITPGAECGTALLLLSDRCPVPTEKPQSAPAASRGTRPKALVQSKGIIRIPANQFRPKPYPMTSRFDCWPRYSLLSFPRLMILFLATARRCSPLLVSRGKEL